uniref:Transcriptional coactivator p15 (PC4) C-terminal domain-containing protein n=1 Tax=Meloidogyne javanica TaxID=6303 RepID=A0A915MCU9_MELJA
MSSSDDSSVDEPVPVTKKGKANGKKAAAPAKAAPAKKPAPAKGKKAAQKDSDSDSSADDQPPPAKNSNKRKAESDESEDDASSGDDEEYQPAKKKETKQPPQKKGKAAAKNGKKEKGGGKAAAATNVEINSDGNEMFPIGMKRFAAINTFKGQLNVDIREYYQKDGGKWLPGKKGISLTQAQFFEFEKVSFINFLRTDTNTQEEIGIDLKSG